ncbi:hypothetical protein ABZP36_004149 [Zizania latifolia]
MALNCGLRTGIRLLATGAEASKTGKRSPPLPFPNPSPRRVDRAPRPRLGFQWSSRGFHATGVKRMGGHGHDEPYYLHAKHMYNLHRMKHQKLKVSLAVLGAVGIGIAVPLYAVVFQQQKTASA